MHALAQNVTVIPARRAIGFRNQETEIKKLRVAAYCRVSTDHEEQESSYETQVNHYTNYIKSKEEWEFVKVYADDGISGTNILKREAFNQMIDDAMAGKIDLILTKSISRFSRNTVDCLKYTRQLKDLNIAVFFEKENINTLDSKGEVLITIMAALAQQESESISANIRLGIQYRNQQGKIRVNHSRFLGYTKDKDGKLIIVEEQAEIVKRIYREYLDGKSLLQIKRGLETDGIQNGAGHTKWNESNIKQILTNEKYIGDALLQKTYTVSILDKKRARNNGQMPKYYVENSHEAIIDKEVFLKVQNEIVRRANLTPNGKKRVYSSKYALSGIVFCGHCGDIYRRVYWNNRGKKRYVWRCVSRVLKKKSKIDCPARTMEEKDIQYAVVTAVNDAFFNKSKVSQILKKNIVAVIFDDIEAKIDEIDKELESLQNELVRTPYNEQVSDSLGEKIINLRKERQAVLTEASERKELKIRMQEMIDFLDKQQSIITEYSETLTRRLVESLTIYDEKVVVTLKSGIKMEVEV